MLAVSTVVELWATTLKQHATALLIGILSSVAATWLTGFTSAAGDSRPGLIALLLAPVPALALFFVAALTTVVAWAISTRIGAAAEAKIHRYEEAVAGAQAQAAEVTRRLQELTADVRAKREAKFATARRVIAVVQSPGLAGSPTRDEVCQILMKFEGNSQSEVEINDVVGWLLEKEVLHARFRKIEVDSSWQQKLGFLQAHAG